MLERHQIAMAMVIEWANLADLLRSIVHGLKSASGQLS